MCGGGGGGGGQIMLREQNPLSGFSNVYIYIPGQNNQSPNSALFGWSPGQERMVEMVGYLGSFPGLLGHPPPL